MQRLAWIAAARNTLPRPGGLCIFWTMTEVVAADGRTLLVAVPCLGSSRSRALSGAKRAARWPGAESWR